MSTIVRKIREEPALLVGFVSAVLILLTAFGVPLTEGQQGAIIGVVIAIGAIIVRQSVTPNVKVGALEDNLERHTGGLMAGSASDVPEGDPVDVIPREEPGRLDLANAATVALVALLTLFFVVLLL